MSQRDLSLYDANYLSEMATIKDPDLLAEYAANYRSPTRNTVMSEQTKQIERIIDKWQTETKFPGVRTDTELRDLIRLAIEDEREECAKIATTTAFAYIAAAIRKRGQS